MPLTRTCQPWGSWKPCSFTGVTVCSQLRKRLGGQGGRADENNFSSSSFSSTNMSFQIFHLKELHLAPSWGNRINWTKGGELRRGDHRRRVLHWGDLAQQHHWGWWPQDNIIVMLMMRTNRMNSGWLMLIRSPGSENSEAGRPPALDDEGFPGGEVHRVRALRAEPAGWTIIP